jgi:membrane protease YdiL (CAAX protease family)
VNDPDSRPDEPFVTAELVIPPGYPPPPPQPGLPLAFALILCPLVVQLATGMFIMLVVAAILAAMGAGVEELQSAIEPYEVYLLPIATFTTLLVSLAIAVVFFGRQTGRCLGWRGFTFTQLIALVLFLFPLAILASEATNVVAELLSRVEPDWLRAFRESGGETFDKFSQLVFPLVFVAGCLLPGVGEEILCRGVIGRGLIARHGLIAGSLWASFLFGAMHIEPVQAFGAFILGLGLQFVFLATRSLAAPIFCHTVNNAFAFIAMRFRQDLPLPGISSAPDEGLHIPIHILVASAVSLIFASLLLLQIRTRWQLANGEEWSTGYVSADRPPPELNAVPISRPVSKILLSATLVAFAVMIATLAAQAV